MDDGRYSREAAFHDVAFADNRRARIGAAYTALAPFFEAYEDEVLVLGRDSRVLEYGCGEGSQAFTLAGAGAHVAAIDISTTAIDHARARAIDLELDRKIEFHLMNAEQLELPDESFDLVCGSAILHHLDLRRAYPEVRRVLRSGGTAVFAEPLGHNPVVNLFRRFTPSMRTDDEHPLLDADLRLAEEHFSDVRVRYFGLATLLAIPLARTPYAPRAVTLLHRADQRLLRAATPLQRQAWAALLVLSTPPH